MHRIADCGGRTPAEQMWRLGYERYAPQVAIWRGRLGSAGAPTPAALLGAHINRPEQARTGPNRPEDVAKALNSLYDATVVAH